MPDERKEKQRTKKSNEENYEIFMERILATSEVTKKRMIMLYSRSENVNLFLFRPV